MPDVLVRQQHTPEETRLHHDDPSEQKGEVKASPQPPSMIGFRTAKEIEAKTGDTVDRLFGNLAIVDRTSGSLLAGLEGQQRFKPQENATDSSAVPKIGFTGAHINRELEPGTHVVKAGDNLDSIARKHMGPDATGLEVRNHADEIARLNGKKGYGAVIQPNEKLRLPGHTADGGMVLEDHEGTRRTSYPDGTLRIDYKDTSGSIKRPDGSEVKWENSERRRALDVQDVALARRSMLDAAGKRGLDSAGFRDLMQQFESRATKQPADIPLSQVQSTYENVARMLNGGDDKATSVEQRKVLAGQVLRQAADPTSIDQGDYNTCTVASLESRTYTRTPAAAAKLVADVALDGKYTASQGTTVKVDPQPHGESNQPWEDGTRSHASEIFQVTATNLHWRHHHFKTGENIRYSQMHDTPEDKPVPADRSQSGESLVYAHNGKPVQPKDHEPGLPDSALQPISNMITGKLETDVLINYEHNVDGKSRQGMTLVKSAQHLEETLKRLDREGKFPVILGVHTANEPFWTTSNGGENGGAGGDKGGTHALTVTGFKDGKATVDNQWGKAGDFATPEKALKVEQLFQAMKKPQDSARDLAAQIVRDKHNGIYDGAREFDVLRLKYQGDMIGKNELARQLSDTMQYMQRRWEQEIKRGTIDAAERERALRKYDEIKSGMLKKSS